MPKRDIFDLTKGLLHVLLIAAAVAIGCARVAHANCSSPAGFAGTIEYFSASEQVFKYCDGTSWQPWIKTLGNLSDVDTAGATAGNVLLFSGGLWIPGTVSGGGGSADNLGNHTATQNIMLGSNWLSGDGGNEGVVVDSNGNVGINTTTPFVTLTVQGPVESASWPFNSYFSDGTTAYAQDVGGGIGFSGKVDGTTNVWMFGGIRGGKENGTSGDKLGYLSFHTRNSATSQAEAMRISSGGKVGIGDTTPDYRLDVEDTTTITSGGTIGSAHQLTANPAAASTAYLTGLDGRIYTAGSSNFTGALQGLEADAVHQGAGTASSIRAVRAAAVNNNGGAVASGTGGAFSVENASGGGVITNGTAVSAEVDHKNTTTIGTATGLYSRVDNGSTGMITNAYGVYAELANSGGGAIANWYGLYIPALTGAAPTTNRYGVYVGDAGRNYFAGNVGIGDTAPTHSLSLMKSGDDASINLRTYDNSTNSYIFFDRARGTSSSPQALTAGTQIVGIDAYGYDGSAFAYTGGVYLNAEEAFTGSARGSRLSFLVTPNGTTSSITAMRINNAGYVGLGPNASSPGATLDDSGSFALSGDLTPAQITANQNNYNPANLATVAVLRLSTDASRDITGLQGGSDGRIITIINVGTSDIVLKNDVTSTAANRFLFGADLTLAAGQSAMLWYDSAVSRWRGVSTPSSSGGIESVSGLSAPSYGLTCTRRIQTTSTAAQTSSCNAGEIMTGGGCTHTSTSFTTEDSGPTADTTWSCEWSGAGATGTAYAICCSY